jgi:hypothetical protein
MRFSLQTREIIADSIETVTCAQHHDANISIPGCDKNMPGVLMAAARHNRKSNEQWVVLTFCCGSITNPRISIFSCCTYRFQDDSMTNVHFLKALFS